MVSLIMAVGPESTFTRTGSITVFLHFYAMHSKISKVTANANILSAYLVKPQYKQMSSSKVISI